MEFRGLATAGELGTLGLSRAAKQNGIFNECIR